jgi:hypothetical protein
MLGSVSHEMLHAAPVPVTIVKMPAQGPGDQAADEAST